MSHLAEVIRVVFQSTFFQVKVQCVIFALNYGSFYIGENLKHVGIFGFNCDLFCSSVDATRFFFILFYYCMFQFQLLEIQSSDINNDATLT